MSSVQPDQSRLQQFLDNPPRALWTMAIPIMVTMGIHTVYSLVDMIFVGRLGGESIAAVAFNMPLIFFSMGITVGLGSGITATIARYIGARDKVNADNAAEHSVIIGVVISLLLLTGGLVLGNILLTALGATGNLHELALSYFTVICIGIPFMVFSTFFRSILAGEGDMKLPMIVSAIGTILNIILDPIFIFSLGFGVKGAAMATIISQSIVFIIFCYFLFVKEHSYITFRMKDFSPNLEIVKNIFTVGIPASMSMIIMSLGGGVFNRILISYSSDVVASYQITGRLDMLVFLSIMSIGTAMTTIVGMFYGAQEIDKLKQIVKYGMSRAVFIAALSGVFIFITAPWAMKIFTRVENIQAIGVTYLRLISWVYPLIAVGMTSGRILQGLGKGIPVLILTLIRVLLISAPLASFFTFILEKPIEWVWYSMMISTVCAASLSLACIRYSFRQLEV